MDGEVGAEVFLFCFGFVCLVGVFLNGTKVEEEIHASFFELLCKFRSKPKLDRRVSPSNSTSLGISSRQEKLDNIF